METKKKNYPWHYFIISKVVKRLTQIPFLIKKSKSKPWKCGVRDCWTQAHTAKATGTCRLLGRKAQEQRRIEHLRCKMLAHVQNYLLVPFVFPYWSDNVLESLWERSVVSNWTFSIKVEFVILISINWESYILCIKNFFLS